MCGFLLPINWSNVFKNISLPTKIFKTVCVMIVEDMLTLLKLAPVSEVLLAENLGQDFQRLCLSFWKIKSEYFRWLRGLLVLRVLHWKVILIASQLHVSSALNIPCIMKCRNFLLSFEAVSCLYNTKKTPKRVTAKALYVKRRGVCCLT